MRRRASTAFAVVSVAVGLSIACGGGSAPPAGGTVSPVYDENTGRLQQLKYDRNKDGVIDSVSFMDGNRVLRVEIDKDQDGRVERWEYYGDGQRLEKVGISRANDGRPDAWSYPAADGQTTRVEVSAARTGAIDRVEHYTGDVLVRVEADTNGDGRMDRWETFADGRLASLAFDSAFRGTPDRRLTYGRDGAVLVEVDPEGDGTFIVQN